MARLGKSDFDAAMVPGFREATRVAYQHLTETSNADMQAFLDADGKFFSEMESARACPGCTSPPGSATGFLEKAGMHIVKCDRCALIYSANVLDADCDQQRYVQSMSQAAFEALKKNETYAALERIKCRYIVQQMEQYHSGKGRLLEIGSGPGRLLDAAREAGWTTAGIEVNADFADMALQAGHEIRHGRFPADMEAGASFDAIAMLDILEHLHDPLTALIDVRGHISVGGILVVQVPNVDSLLVRAEGKASTVFSHGHWNYFSPSTLGNIAEAAGFSPLLIETIISEHDRIWKHPKSLIDKISLELRGVRPPADFDADWLHAHGMGYKVLGIFTIHGS